MVPGSETAIDAASRQGWTAIVLCIAMLLIMGGCVWLVRKAFADKDAIAARLTIVEDYQRVQIIDLHQKTVSVLADATAALRDNAQAAQSMALAINGLNAKCTANSR